MLSVQRDRSALATASRSWFPATGSWRPTGSAPTARSGSSTSDGCWSSKVPLSEELRNELAGIRPERDCDRLAELSGLAHTAGSLHIHGRGEIGLHLDLASPAAARRAFSLLRELGVTSEIRTYQRRAFGRETRYQLHVEGAGRALEVLQEAGVVGARRAPLERPPKRVVARACCRAAYLRGSLLGGGTLSGPRSPHLEVRTATVEGAEFVAADRGTGRGAATRPRQGTARGRLREGDARRSQTRSPRRGRATPCSCWRSRS